MAIQMLGEETQLEIHPLKDYTMIERENQPEEDTSVPARIGRLENQWDESGLRRSVDAVMVVTDHEFPHVLVLQVANAFYKLPGGYLDPTESFEDGIISRLHDQLGVPDGKGGYVVPGGKRDWAVGDCLAVWWRPNFDTFMYPYLPRQQTAPKEVRKVFLIHLPPKKIFAVPTNMKLVAVPISELYDNAARYGPLMALIPGLLSRYIVDQHQKLLSDVDASFTA